MLDGDVVGLGYVTSLSFPVAKDRWEEGEEAEAEEDVLLTLHIPSSLHPSLGKIRREVKDVVRREIALAAGGAEGDGVVATVGVNVRSKTPVPFVRAVEEEEEVLEGLGPGLRNVGHFLAVYSCKVGWVVAVVVCDNV